MKKVSSTDGRTRTWLGGARRSSSITWYLYFRRSLDNEWSISISHKTSWEGACVDVYHDMDILLSGRKEPSFASISSLWWVEGTRASCRYPRRRVPLFMSGTTVLFPAANLIKFFPWQVFGLSGFELIRSYVAPWHLTEQFPPRSVNQHEEWLNS